MDTINTCNLLGNQGEARRHLERVVAGVPNSAQALPSSGSGPTEHWPATPSWHGWVQGHPEQGLQAVSTVVAQAIAAGHALSIRQILAYAGCPIALWSGDADASQHYLGPSMDYTSKNELSIFADWNRCHFGQLDIRRSRPSQLRSDNMDLGCESAPENVIDCDDRIKGRSAD
ncbi:hypothetical protein [Reyranella sp.]|uniref:hypothetical protein n=1 Tax=Reyranella sp. TaxID=1929291 RepID=UPI003D0B6C38